MKVYQVNVVCGGSTGRIAVDLSKLIQRDGGICRIAFGRGKVPEGVNSIKISDKSDLYWHAVMTRITDKHGLYSRRATRKLIKDIQLFEPDIIHLHNIHGYYVNYEMLFEFLAKYGRPVVWTLHDCWAFTGHCAHYDSISCMKWKTECDICPNFASYPAAWNGKQTRDNYLKKKYVFCQLEEMTLVTPSKWLSQQLQQSFLKSYPRKIFYNGIDLDVFHPVESDIRRRIGASDKILLLGVASVWTRNKGLDDLCKLSVMLDDRYLICLVGLTRRQCVQLPGGVIGIEKTSDVLELAKYYSAADVFLNLTYEDTLPTTNIEALACGTPVITYDAGGSPEMLSENCGIVVPKGDVDSVKEALKQRFWEEPDCLVQCRTQAEQFDKEICYTKYVSLYRNIAGRNYE